MNAQMASKLKKSILSFSTVVSFGLAQIPSMAALASPITATLKPGESTTQTISISVPTRPPKADVVFAFDCTGSMGDIIDTAKAQSANIIAALAGTGVDINYGVMSYMDYPNYYSSYGYSNVYGSAGTDYAYKLNQAITSDSASVSNAINGLNIGSGGDGPQDYTRVLYESYADTSVGWRTGAKKILINFGDNVPHDNNLNEGISSTSWSTGGDPGRDEIVLNADDLDLQTVLADMKKNNVTLLECQTYSSYKDMWDYWTGITGGAAYGTTDSDLVNNIVTAVTNSLTASTIDGLTLKASSGYESWLTSVNPTSYSGTTGTNVSFEAKLTVPAGTAPGTYKFTLNALDSSNVNYGSQDVEITVASAAPVYDFKGFFQPVDMGGVINTAKAGCSIPIKFSLGGDKGLDIFETGYPKVYDYDAPSGAATDSIETTTAGNSSLSYDASLDQYIYVWKTEKSWSGKAKKFVVKLKDGTEHEAYFSFK